MHKRIRVLLIVVLVLCGALIVWSFMPNGEPRYAGKSLSAWIDSLPPFGWDLDQRRSLGSNAIPVLLLAIQKRDLSNRFQLENFYEGVHAKAPAAIKWLLPKPPQDPGLIRAGAALTLVQMGEEAKPAIPKLIKLLRANHDFRVRLGVANALLGMGHGDRTVTTAMVEALKDDNWQVRRFAADALKQLDPETATKAGIK